MARIVRALAPEALIVGVEFDPEVVAAALSAALFGGSGGDWAGRGTGIDDAGLARKIAAIDDALAGCERGRKIAAKEGVLVTVVHAQYGALPDDDTSYDVVVLWDLIGGLAPERRCACLQQTLKVLRRGGRCVVIERVPRGGLGALLGGPKLDPTYTTSGGAERALDAEGFKAVRCLAKRNGLAFTEGIKPVL